MKKPLQIGITGGIGSGKSLVAKIFAQLGVPVYDADSHAKKLMTTDGILISGIKQEFGHLSYNPDGSLNRTYLAKHVFSDQAKLNRLNNLVHPRVKVDYENWVTRQQALRYVLKEAALLFEAGTEKTLDKIIVVYAPETMRIKRVMDRDPHRTRKQVEDIIAKQMPEEEKLKQADYVIVNDESELVVTQVLRLHEQFANVNGLSADTGESNR